VSRRLAGPVPRLGRAAIAAQIVGALLFAAVLLASEGVRLPFAGGGDWTLQATFSDVGGIHGGERTPVLVAGVPSGIVTAVRVERGLALVTMRMSPSARGVVRSDASAQVEPRSALEDMTIDISPGSPAAPDAVPGARIPAARTSPTTTLDQITAVLDADTRTQLEIVLDQLARGTRGRSGALQDAVARLHGLLDPASRVAAAVAHRRVLLTELVGSLAKLGAAAERHDASLAGALRSGATTLATTATHESAIESSVRELPSTLASVNGALGAIRTLATPLVPTLAGLGSTAAALPKALQAVQRSTPAFNELVTAARSFATNSGAALHGAAGMLGALAPTARALTPAIARVEPIVSAVNSRRAGIAQLGERFSGVLSTDDANGPILRGLGSFEQFNPADFGAPSAGPAQKAALASKAAEALTLSCLHGGMVACLVRYLIPGLPRSVR
jgi:phospholipid/cholesterol/gamma-HCH transport system substrate-binding protein